MAVSSSSLGWQRGCHPCRVRRAWKTLCPGRCRRCGLRETPWSLFLSRYGCGCCAGTCLPRRVCLGRSRRGGTGRLCIPPIRQTRHSRRAGLRRQASDRHRKTITGRASRRSTGQSRKNFLESAGRFATIQRVGPRESRPPWAQWTRNRCQSRSLLSAPQRANSPQMPGRRHILRDSRAVGVFLMRQLIRVGVALRFSGISTARCITIRASTERGV